MINLLLALHPKSWRDRYGAELRDLLEGSPMTASVALDVLRNAVVQHARARAGALRLAAAVALTVTVETAAVRSGLTDNILWLPTSPAHAVALAAVTAPWVPVAADARRAVHRRRRRRGVSTS